jgi:hypothetical protein
VRRARLAACAVRAAGDRACGGTGLGRGEEKRERSGTGVDLVDIYTLQLRACLDPKYFPKFHYKKEDSPSHQNVGTCMEY